MTTDLIRYDLLVQEALKGVVRRVLTDAARDGLPGEHHFYVSFRTDKPGVRISSRLRERYPADMTIVLQHQFENLVIGDQAFEVGLSFSGIPERLRVPFDSLIGFFDPSVQFGLKFEAQEAGAGEGGGQPAPPEGAGLTAIGAPLPRIGSRKLEAVPDIAKPEPAKKPAVSRKKSKEPKPEEPAGDGGGEVVSLDAFRRKP